MEALTLPDRDTLKTHAHGERRETILDSAITEFSEVGFAGATMRRIGERARVNHQLIVHHFQNMDGLWRAAMRQIASEAQAISEAQLNTVTSEDSVTRLIAFVDSIVLFAAQRPEAYRIMIIETASRSDRFTWFVDAHIRELFNQFQISLEDAQQSGQASPGDAWSLYYAMIGVATSRFTLANENALLGGPDPFHENSVEVTRRLCRRVLGIPNP
ncbi:MAG: TetR/AcrR family transcriptional regulator [Pseudomonadota bacterium]